MTNALILDPIYRNVDDLTGFKQIAHQLHGWSFTRLSFDASQSYPVEYLKQVYATVERADIILCFGDYFWFMFTEAVGSTFADLILHKLSSGAPFFCELVRAAEKIRSGYLKASAQNFFRRLGVLPTRNRIFSRTDAHADHVSGSSCWFRKDDGCLMNPQILGGIDKVLISSANELEYFEDVFPIIQIGPTHEIVDEGDLFVPGRLGQRPSVALERRTETEFAVIIAGDVAKDCRQTVGGVLHGWTENERFVGKIINHLAASIDTWEKRSLIAYAAFAKLEMLLGELVQNVLEKSLGGAAIHSAFPPRVLQNISQGGSPDYAMAHYSDLIDIVLHNWGAFTTLFGSSRTQFKKVLTSINYGSRRFIAHPHKAKQSGYEFAREEICAIEAAVRLVESAQQRLRMA
jgi:hypothetical protein